MPRNLTFSIDFAGGKTTVQELHALEVQLKKVTSEYRGLVNDINKASNRNNPNLAQWGQDAEKARIKMHDLSVQIKETRTELNKQYKDFQNVGKASTSVSALEREYARLKATYMDLSREARKSQLGEAMAKEARQVKDEIDKAHAAVNNYRNNVGNYPNNFGGGLFSGGASGLGIGSLFGGGAAFGAGAMVGQAAIQAASAAVKKAYEINKEIDTLQGAVAKTTGLTADEVERLTENLKQLDNVTSTSDLLKIAEEAGRFGVQGAEGVEAFTKAVNLLSIGLGDEFSGDVTDITTQVAQLSNVMYGATDNGEVMAKHFLALGNVLNGLANSGAASAEGIADVAQRMSSTLIPLGYTQEEILGISSALLESGVNVERGATAFTRINGILRKNYLEVANRLQLDAEEFRKALDTSPVEAFNMVLEKTMAMAGGSGTNLTVLLKQMGINSEYAKEVFNAWGNNQELFNTRIEESRVLIGSINTLLRDQETLTNTVSGQWQRLTNAFSDLFINAGLQDEMKNFFSIIATGLTAISNALDRLKEVTGSGLFTWIRRIVAPGSAIKEFMQWYPKWVADQKRIEPTATQRMMGQAYSNLAQNRGLEVYNEFLPQFGDGSPLFNSSNYFRNVADAIKDPGKPGPKAKDYGQEGSVTWLNHQIDLLKNKLNKANPNDFAYIQKLQDQIKGLNDRLEYAQLLLRRAANPNVNPDMTTTVPSLSPMGASIKNSSSIGDLLADIIMSRNTDSPAKFALREDLANAFLGLNGDNQLTISSTSNAFGGYMPTIPQSIVNDMQGRNMEVFRQIPANMYNRRERIIRERNQPLLSPARLFSDATPAEREVYEEVYNEAFDQAKNITDAIFDYKEAMREENLRRELKALDREYAAKTAAAEGNATLQEAIEIERAKKEEQIRRAAFEQEKKAKIAQALISAAVAIIQAFSQLGPIAGAIAAVGVGVTTGLQIAAIRDTTFAEGGHTGEGFDKDHTGERVAGVVHAKEYVVNKRQVKKFKPVIDMFEKDRLQTIRGFQNGGYTSPTTYTTEPQYMAYSYAKNAANTLDYEALKEIIEQAVITGAYQGTRRGAMEGTETGQQNALRLKDRINKQENEF